MWKLYLVSSVIQEMVFNETKRSQMGLCSNIYMWFVFLLLQTMHQHMQSTLEVTVLHLISSDARRHNNPSFATETAFASNTAHPLQMVIRLHSSAQAFWHFEWDSSWKKSQTTTCYLWNSLKNGIFSTYFSINWWKPDFFQQQYDSQPKLHPLFFLERKCFKFRHAASASSLISPKWLGRLGLRPLRISKDGIVFSDIEKRHGTDLATKKQSIFLEVSWDCHGGKWAFRKCWTLFKHAKAHFRSLSP